MMCNSKCQSVCDTQREASSTHSTQQDEEQDKIVNETRQIYTY